MRACIGGLADDGFIRPERSMMPTTSFDCHPSLRHEVTIVVRKLICGARDLLLFAAVTTAGPFDRIQGITD